ncbi:MAG: sulfite exporter TauE/SafE family protein [Candidatus Bathyarchaeota archaeon]|nr:sulfite exporter TauE/SafE family protein [Candidatus Bathyarchaeota archaeon]
MYLLYKLKVSSQMNVFEQITNPYLASLVLGLFYGLTACTSACLPYLASYIAGIGAGFKQGVIVTSYYNGGRIVAYASIGTAVGLLRLAISDEALVSYQQYASVAFGAAIVVIGITVLLKKTSNCSCPPKQMQKGMGFLQNISQRFDIRAFFMGFTRGLVVCPPLVTLLVVALTLSAVNLTVLAVLFGVGTAISPLLILGGATGWLLNKAPDFREWLSKIGGGLLIIMGLSVTVSGLLVFF